MVTDGKKTARAVSSLREAFAKSKDEKKPVQLLNCSIKPNNEEQLEILAKNHSKVLNSPKKFVLDAEAIAMDSKNIQLSDLHDLATGQIVNVVCKVVALSLPQEVHTKNGKQLVLQNLTVGDAKACTQLTLWENQVNMLKENETYDIKYVKIKQFNFKKSLSASPDSTYIPTSDIGNVEQEMSDDEHTTREVINGEIDVVVNVEKYNSCAVCKSKVKFINDIVECTKCTSTMKATKSVPASTAKVIIDGDGNRVLTMFQNISTLTEDVQGDTIVHKLLMVPKHAYSISENNIIYSVKG